MSSQMKVVLIHKGCISCKLLITTSLSTRLLILLFPTLEIPHWIKTPLLLHSPGVNIKDITLDALIDVCNQCHASLKLNKVPKFSLKNYLYCGHLPDEFHDLTWVEEMAVVIYRANAYVTRLYFSDDPKNPHVFHGNTCAHEQNVVSTAKALPRTAADISNTISVLFVGPSKDVPKSMLKNVFCIRKAKVCSFLQWLRLNHQMYCEYDIDISALDTFEDDDALPGIENRVIFDIEANTKERLNEDSASIDPPVASQLYADSNYLDSSNNPQVHVMLEHTGIADPDGASIPARSLVASALCNLGSGIQNNSDADLYIFRGSSPISEYNNPSLFPGMFPFQHSSLMALVVLMFLNMTHQFHLGLRLNICWNWMIHLSGGIIPCLLLSTFISTTSITYTWLFQ